MGDPLRCYLAGPSSDLPRVLRWAERLEAIGVEITLRWWEGFRPTEELTDDDRYRVAWLDADAIDRAQLVWCLAPGVRSDALVEMGYAICVGRHRPDAAVVYVSGPRSQRGVFATLADGEFDSDDEAFAAIERVVREGQ